MTDAPAPPSAPPRGRFDAASIRPLLADWVCVAIFVFLGKENHGYEQGVTWFLQVWWPLAVGVLIGGVIMRIYTDDSDWPGRLLAAIAIAVMVGGPLRALTGRPMFSVFTVIALVMLSILMYGWRLLAIAFRQSRARS